MTLIRIAVAGALLAGIGCELADGGGPDTDQNIDSITSDDPQGSSLDEAIPPVDPAGDSADDEASAQIPSGAIMFFDTPDCPSGWRALDAARGRVLVGLPDRGTLGAAVGEALSDREDRTHSHAVVVGNHFHQVSVKGNTVAAGAHNHQWSSTSHGDWFSYDSGGTEVTISNWDDGHSSGGSGTYPISTGSRNLQRYFTANAGNHSHAIDVTATAVASGNDVAGSTLSSVASTAQVIPYIQFLVCRKE